MNHDGDFAVVRGVRDPARAEAAGLSTDVVNDYGGLRAVDAFNGRVSSLDDMMRDGMLDHLQRTTGEFNPTPRAPLAGGDMPPM